MSTIHDSYLSKTLFKYDLVYKRYLKKIRLCADVIILTQM